MNPKKSPWLLCLLFAAGCVSMPEHTNTTLVEMENMVFEQGEPVYLDGEWLAEQSARQRGGSISRSQAQRIQAKLPSGFAEDVEVSSLDHTMHSAGSGWLKTGLYPILLQDGEQTRTVEIKIEDTTPAKFVKYKDTYYVESGRTFHLKQQVEVDDYSDVTLRAYGLLDSSLPGEYPCRLVAEDASGNTSKLDVTVLVVDPYHPLAEMPVFIDYGNELDPVNEREEAAQQTKKPEENEEKENNEEKD